MEKCLLCGNEIKENYRTILEDVENIDGEGSRCAVIVKYEVTVSTKIVTVPTLSMPIGEYCEKCSEKILWKALRNFFKEEI